MNPTTTDRPADHHAADDGYGEWIDGMYREQDPLKVPEYLDAAKLREREEAEFEDAENDYDRETACPFCGHGYCPHCCG